MRSKVDIGPLSEISSKKRARVERKSKVRLCSKWRICGRSAPGCPLSYLFRKSAGERYEVRLKVARVAKVRPLGDGSPSLFGRLSAPSEVAWSREDPPVRSGLPVNPDGCCRIGSSGLATPGVRCPCAGGLPRTGSSLNATSAPLPDQLNSYASLSIGQLDTARAGGRSSGAARRGPCRAAGGAGADLNHTPIGPWDARHPRSSCRAAAAVRVLGAATPGIWRRHHFLPGPDCR